MGENEYKISLGVKLDIDDIQSQIDGASKNIKPIEIKVDTEAKELTKSIQEALSSLSKGTKNALTLNTDSLEASLKDVSTSIKDIRTSLGTLDSKSGMKNLLSSINQISAALDKASNQFESLNANLNALSGKDLNLNFGINMGGSNPIGRNAAYGNKVRNETLPQLKQQMNDLVKYYNSTYKESLSEFEVLQKMVSGTKLNTGDFFETFLFGKDSVASRMNGGSLASQMQAYKQYIDMFKQAASLRGLDITSVTSQFSKSADDLIQDAQDIQTGAKEMEDGFEKLKQVFGGGNNINVEGISKQLDSIVVDLGEIKNALQSLSSGVSIDGLTQSFDKLSETIEKLVSNVSLAKNALGDGIDGVSVGDNASKQVEKSADAVIRGEERKQQAFRETAAEAKKLDSVSIDISSGNIDDLRSALKNLKVDNTSIENVTKELNELGIVAKNVSGTLKDGTLAKWEIKGVQTTADGLERVVTITKTLGQEGWSSAQKYSQSLDNVDDKLKEISASAQKVSDKLNSGFDGNTDFDKEISNVNTEFSKLANQSDELRVKLDTLRQSFNDIKAANEAVNAADDTEELFAAKQRLIEANERYEQVLKDIQNQLRINRNEEEKQRRAERYANNADNFELDKIKAMQRLKGLFGENTEASRKFGSELNRLQKELDECGDATGLKKINKEIDILQSNIKQANVSTDNFATRFKKQWSEYASYFSVASLFMWAEQALQSMFEQVKLIDSAMTELKKVTDETDASYNQFLSNAADKAKEIGTTIDGLVSSTADFARLGYGFEDSQKLAEVANIYAVVGDEIEGVEGATQSLVSTLAAFKDEMGSMSDSDFAMSIVDKMNEVSNNFAISSGGIGEALQRSASSMAAANNTLDETIALITAANEVVQNPEKVGNAFKTMSMRIRGAKTELEEMGEDTSGMAESTATLRQELLALSGVDIMLNENTFKSTYQIMDELSQKWESLSDIAQASITELVAGKHQGNVMSSIMANFDTARAALETSLESSGSAMREHEKWQESLEARLNSLKASWQSLSQTVLNSNFLKFLTDATIVLVDTVDDLISNFGVLGTVIGGLNLASAFKAGFATDENGNKVGTYFQDLKGLPEIFKSISSMAKDATTSTGGLRQKISDLVLVGKQGAKDIGSAFKNMATDIGKALAFAAIIKAVQDIVSWISEAGKKAETSAEKFSRIGDELSDVDSELNGLESELSSVEGQIDALLAKDELTFTEQEELDRLREVSRELERQIELTKTLQKSLQKSQSDAAMNAYSDYLTNTSFYSAESKADREKEAEAMGNSIGNIAGLVIGAIVAGAVTVGSGGTLTAAGLMAGAGIGSVIGSVGGGVVGGAISNASYDNEITVGEVFERMNLERLKLEKAADDAEEAYKNADEKDRENLKAEWLEASTALNDFDAALANHASQVSQYLNSVDYNSLTTKEDKQKYLDYGDYLDKYNIEMGVKGAKDTALDRYFSDELITKEAEELRLAIETALNSGEDIHFYDLDDGIINSNDRLKEMGITITEVISYFKDLKEAQAKASNNYDTYDMVADISLLSDGVARLTDAFVEFNETGIVSAATLVELHEVFGNLGEDWGNYVDVVTSGVATIGEVREQTELLAESHLSALKDGGGLKFNILNANGEYEYSADKYKTYLSTINQLESIGVENAKEYIDALQQQAMAQDVVNQMRADAAQIDTLENKENKTEAEIAKLNELKAKLDDFNGYIANVELVYGVEIKNDDIVELQSQLSSHNDVIKKNEEYLSEVKNYDYFSDVERAREAYAEYERLQAESNEILEQIQSDNTQAAKSAMVGSPASAVDWELIGEGIDSLFGTDWFDTSYDDAKEKLKESEASYAEYENILLKQKESFDRMVEIAKDANVDLSDINIDGFVAGEDGADEIFEQVYNRVKPALESNIDAYGKLADEIEAEINDELNNLGLRIDFGRNFNKVVIDSFKSNLEQLGAALSESVSGIGLSIDSMEAIENIFGDLDGFDASALFEQTANGIRLNRTEFSKLNDEFKSSNVDILEGEMSSLKTAYENTKDKLHDCKIGTEEYNSTLRDLSAIESQIAANEELVSQMSGVFSAYQEWQRMEASGQERDMYENLIKGLENVDDEISRGWMDDGTIEFLELLTGKELSTAPIEDLKKAYSDLKKEIGDSGYSIRDFFTVDKDGNSTNTGVYNFLEAIESEIDGVIKKSEDGRIVGFNFEVAGGNEAIAKTLGISEELVEIMVRASDDAGFVVDVDGAVTQISYLKEQAENAIQTLTILRDSGLKELQGANIDFDLDSDGSTLVDQQKAAIELLEKFKKDGKIDLQMEGAQDALDIAKYLTIRLDDLTQPRYMEIDVSSVEENLREPIIKMQEFEELVKQENLLTITGDTEGLKDVETKMVGIVDYIAGLDEETKLKLGIDTEWTKDQIYNALKMGEIEIPAQVELDIQMSDSLKDMRLMMMNQLGLVSDAEVKLKVGYNIDDSVVNELTEEEKEVMVKYLADGGDIEEFDEWLSKTRNIEVIAKAFGIEDVDNLALKLEGLDDKTVQAIAEAIGNGDIETLQSTIDGLDGNTVQAIAQALGYNDVETLKTAINNMQGNTVDAIVNTEGQSDKVDTLQSSIFGLKGTTVDVIVNFIKSGFDAVSNWLTGGSDINGTANVNGTAFANGTSGKAFKQGDWRTKKTETALVGELGREIVVTPNNRWHTVGDNGAEFANIPRGSIVFNHKQTEELLANGKVTSNGGRGRALLNGTAYDIGSSGYGGLGKVSGESINIEADSVNVSGDTNGNNADSSKGEKDSKDSKDKKDEFEETFDWIEIAISRIERAIDRLDKKANNIYKSWSSRNSALTDEINKVGEEIELQEDAAQRYLQEANSVGLSSSYAEMVRNGDIDINTITDEDLAEKIGKYKEWYEKYLDCIDAAEELRETESELYAQRFENIETQYDAMLQGYEHTESMLNEYISQAEEQGYIVSKKYYQALVDNEKENISELKREQADLIAARDNAVAEGKITKGSEAWLEQCAAIDDVTLAIEEATTAILEYDNAIREIDWSIFDLIQERISGVTEEADFLIELMSNKKLFDDDGKLTSQGLSTMGLHAQNYNTHMYAADTYGEEVAKLDKQIANDPYDQELINRRNELLELQRESILAAEDEKNAIRDMVEEGINLELDALQELIDKKNEELESERDLYEYQKKVKEQTKEIASLEKQMSAYSGDDSEEAKQKIQQIKVDLESARQDLQETEYDKFISDTSTLLDTLYNEYELILNTRLDNIDYLLEGVIESINAAASAEGTIATALGSNGAISLAISGNAVSIKETLASEANKVGATLSSAMNGIWNVGEGNAKSVLTMYGEDFKTKSATIITTLNGIKVDISAMVDDIDKDAKKNTTANKTTTSAKKTPTTATTTTTTNKTSTSTTATKPSTSTSSSSGDGKPKVGDKVKFVSGQYYYDSQGKKPIGYHNRGKEVYITSINTKSWATHPYHISTGSKLGNGDLGWLKLDQLSGYAVGKKNFLNNEVAWTQENGKEFIVRPSDGAILTPIAKGDSVLTSAASNNIWNMANSPAEFIRDNLNFGANSAPNNSNVHSSYIQHFENITFSMPNVHGYNELLTEMQRDKNFEKLILSMTIDRIAGKSSLAKGKTIR